MDIINSAVQACRDAIASKEEDKTDTEEDLTVKKTGMAALFGDGAEAANNLRIFISEIVILCLLIPFSLYYYVKKKGTKEDIKKAETFEKRFIVLLNSLKGDIKNRSIEQAKTHYQDVLNLYNQLRKLPLPANKKQQYFEQIRLLHADLITLMSQQQAIQQ